MRGLRFDRCQPNRVIMMDEDLTGANLDGVYLSKADLCDAYLTGAGLDGADLDGVIGADFTSALNVPAKYLKD